MPSGLSAQAPASFPGSSLVRRGGMIGSRRLTRTRGFEQEEKARQHTIGSSMSVNPSRCARAMVNCKAPCGTFLLLALPVMGIVRIGVSDSSEIASPSSSSLTMLPQEPENNSVLNNPTNAVFNVKRLIASQFDNSGVQPDEHFFSPVFIGAASPTSSSTTVWPAEISPLSACHLQACQWISTFTPPLPMRISRNSPRTPSAAPLSP